MAEKNLDDLSAGKKQESCSSPFSCGLDGVVEKVKKYSPFKLIPSNMALKKLGADHDYLPPPMNAAVSVGEYLYNRLRGAYSKDEPKNGEARVEEMPKKEAPPKKEEARQARRNPYLSDASEQPAYENPYLAYRRRQAN